MEEKDVQLVTDNKSKAAITRSPALDSEEWEKLRIKQDDPPWPAN
jgi:hypothetical protein